MTQTSNIKPALYSAVYICFMQKKLFSLIRFYEKKILLIFNSSFSIINLTINKLDLHINEINSEV